MGSTVDVSIPVSPSVAKRLESPLVREWIGRLVDRALNPQAYGDEALADLLEESRAKARALGLTDDDIDAELAAWKAERRR